MTKRSKPKKVTAAAVSAFLGRAGFHRAKPQGAWPASGFSVTSPRSTQYPYEAVPGVVFVAYHASNGGELALRAQQQNLTAMRKVLEAEFTVEAWDDGRLRVTPKESA